jgi:CheY-like chemotaxis protein
MKPVRFIIVDDDDLDIRLCKLCIKHTLPNVEVVGFTSPEEGLIYLETAFSMQNWVASILLLDINMPTMSGWEFIEKYDALDRKIKNQIRIYFLSSSVDSRDQDKAAANKYITGYHIKPVTAPLIHKLFEDGIPSSEAPVQVVKQ